MAKRNFKSNLKIKSLIFLFIISSILIIITYRTEILYSLPIKYQSIIRAVQYNELTTNKLNNDYNVKFLPKTQFIKVNFKKYQLKIFENKKNNNFNSYSPSYYKTFFLSNYKDEIFFLTKGGEVYFTNINEFENKNYKLSKINSNINYLEPLDMLIHNEEIYISGAKIINKNCNKLVIIKSKIEYNNLNFTEIFKDNKCHKKIQAGKLEAYNKNEIIISTAADLFNLNKADPKPQDNNSLMGKILAVNINNGIYRIFSKGHRNVLGLYVDQESKIVLATDNGPYGGDEINLIKEGSNTGWPIASYGENYNFKFGNKSEYKKNKKKENFEEPIFVFISSIGISQITKITNFSEFWEDNFLVSSLNSKHLFRFSFDDKLSKAIYFEKIYIGERIRTILYLKKKKIILLSLENSGSLGIIK